MNLQTVFFNLVGGLGLFLFGMRAMSDGLQSVAGDSLRRVIGALTNNRIVAVGVGLVVTSVVQSSSVTTVMVVGFVNSNLMTLTQAIGVVLGANIGTTVTGWIIAIKVTKLALPMLGLGVGFYMFARARILKDLGYILFGIGMIFLGLNIMKSGLGGLKGDPVFVEWFSRFGAETFGSLLLAIVAGCLLTIMVQSSSATLGITMALAASGLLSFQASAALILGENIGTTITAQIASIGTNANAKRAARAHLIFNCLGVGVMIVIFQPYVHLIEWLIPHDADFVLGDGSKPYIMEHIAATHSLFNIINVLVFLPFLKPLAGVVTWFVPDRAGRRKKAERHLTVVDPRLLETPAIALEQARQETLHMGNLTGEMLGDVGNLFSREKGASKIREKLMRHEKITDEIQKEVTIFLARIMEGSLNEEQTYEVRSMIRVIDEMESIADYCESLAKYQQRCAKQGIKLSEKAKQEIRDMETKVLEFYRETFNAFRNNDRIFVNKARVQSGVLNEFADTIREAHLDRVNKGTCGPFASLVFSDIMVALRRIKNHTFNIAESAAGIK